jgi:MATE family multidrug resistance protein
MKTDIFTQAPHPFIRSPHMTFIKMSFPVLFSLIAEPLTGLVDTAFVSRLGAVPLAALGVGTMVLSSLFWVFNFLGIGTQTEVAQASGQQDGDRAKQMAGLSLLLGAVFGILVILLFFPAVSILSKAMGAAGDVHLLAVQYLKIRLLGAPAVLVSIAAFGALRGLMDMKTPLWIAVFINALNILLDGIFIFGTGPLPPMGVSGAALASVISQWIGAVWAILAVYKKMGFPRHIPVGEIKKLFMIGRDLFFRTGLIILFLLLTTRSATRIGADAGAAHQAIRQVWIFTALFLDAYAVSGQSLIGYFIGLGHDEAVRKVSFVVCFWSLVTGVVLSFGMYTFKGLVVTLLVPEEAVFLFIPAWTIALITQPVNALAFATDGIHWGTGDYRYLRNVVVLASFSGAAAIYLLNEAAPYALTRVWIIIACWLAIRALFGVLRIWPGIGKSPIKQISRNSP